MLAGLGLLSLTLVVLGVWPYDLHPNDSHAYWVVDPADPYRDAHLGAVDAFLYAPAVAQLLGPFTALPFEVFRVGLGIVNLAGLGAGGLLYALIFPGVIEDIVRGNIHILLALVILVGFRWPGAWAAVLLTKVTPGIGLLWFALRREWGALALAAGVTAVIVAASVALGGMALWVDWVKVLAINGASPRTYTYFGLAPPALVLRLPIAAAIVTWGALTDRRWTVPVAAFAALPVIWPSGFALLLPAPALWVSDRGRHRSARTLAGAASEHA